LPRRCRRLSTRGLGIAVAAFVLAPTPGAAQTPAWDAQRELLQPRLDGDLSAPQRFRKRRTADPRAPVGQPPPGRFTTAAPSRIGAAPPRFGTPPASGAGSTGFDSQDAAPPRRTAKTKPANAGLVPPPVTTFAPPPLPTTTAAPAAAAKPPPRAVRRAPEIQPPLAAARQGATLPAPPEPLPVTNPPPEVHPTAAASRPGAVLPVPPPLRPPGTTASAASAPPPGVQSPNILPAGTPSPRRQPPAEDDPFEAVGIRAGSFVLRPAIELVAAHDSNPPRVPGGISAPYLLVAPELVVRSDWSRHALNADIRGTYTQYGESFSPSLNRPYLVSRIDGRVDVTRDTRIDLENRFIVSTDNPGSPNLQAGLARLPINTTLGGTVGVAHRFNRLELSAKGTVDRIMFQNSLLTDGTSSSNSDRDYNQYAAILRAGYELTPGLKPFVEVNRDTRIHDLEFDRNGLQRDSDGISAKAGSSFEITRTLTGEFAVGYLNRVYQDPTLPAISGTIADGSLIWQATGLTTAKLTAVSTVNESVVAGVSGNLSRDFTLQVDHAFRRWLVGTLKAGYGRDVYVGSDREDSRYTVSGGLVYKLTRTVHVKGEVRQDWLQSSVGGVNYTATTFLVGLRLQR
jgi:hypothetical protein